MSAAKDASARLFTMRLIAAVVCAVMLSCLVVLPGSIFIMVSARSIGA
jgi:hypothetical protein